MTTITIELPDDLAARLTEQASAAQTSLEQFVAGLLAGNADADDWVEDPPSAGWDASLTPEDIAAIEEGLADAAAGRVRPWDEVRPELQRIAGG
jgi:predicted transcriptional regulator